MKKSLVLTLAFAGIILTSVAQPTLTASNITPNVGETFRNQFVNTAGVDDKSGGANQNWDYSNLNDSNASVALQAVTPSSTPYAGSFPNSNLTLKTVNDSAYIYFNSQTNELSELGVVAQGVGNINYTKPKVYLPYPFSYGGFFTDSVVEEYPTFNVMLRGKDSLYGEGYGTLEIPGKSYNNVLRVKYIENITGARDSLITYKGVSLTATISVSFRTISYLYFTPDTHAPLLTNEETETHVTATVYGLITVLDSSTVTKDISYLKAYILPLSFTSFKAALNNKEVTLQWATAQEINTDRFSVQRSLTGNDFTDIAEVKASGKSSGAYYSYSDQSFVKTDVPPSVYYRIKETDKDGKEFYSTTAIVHGNAGIVSIYPNPVRSYINLNIKDVSIADAITIYDAKGHLVQQWHNYEVSQPMNVTSLAKGTYFIQIKIKGKTITTTVVKQ